MHLTNFVDPFLSDARSEGTAEECIGDATGNNTHDYIKFFIYIYIIYIYIAFIVHYLRIRCRVISVFFFSRVEVVKSGLRRSLKKI